MTNLPSDPNRPAVPHLDPLPARLTPPIDVSKVKDEKGVKKLIKEILDAFGWFHWMPSANGFGAQGVHDHLAVKDGVFITVEAKFGTKKPTATQKGFAAQIMANDCFSFCVNERNIDHFVWWLESFEVSKQYGMLQQEIPPEHGSRMLNAMEVMLQPFGVSGRR